MESGAPAPGAERSAVRFFMGEFSCSSHTFPRAAFTLPFFTQGQPKFGCSPRFLISHSIALAARSGFNDELHAFRGEARFAKFDGPISWIDVDAFRDQKRAVPGLVQDSRFPGRGHAA